MELRSPTEGRGRSKSRSNTTLLDEANDSASPTKRSRSRSRGFAFGKDRSPSKRPRSTTKPRAIMSLNNLSSTSIQSLGYDGARDSKEEASLPVAASKAPEDFIDFLCRVQQPQSVEVGKLHKLRLLARNESVIWVDTFISQDGMDALLGLLNRIIDMEWRY